MPYFEAAHIAKQFGLALSKRYERFLATERAALGRKFAVLPSYENAIQVAFDGPSLTSFFHDDWPEDEPGYAHPYASEVELGAAGGGWIPLATIGTEEAQFLVVRAGDEACPVAMWEHETDAFVPCAPTLDSFLGSLGSTKKGAKRPKPAKSQVDLDKVRTLLDKLDDLVDKAASPKRTATLEAGLAKLEAFLAAMPHTSTMDRDDAVVPGLAHHTRGLVLRALGRPAEALAALEHAVIDGVPRSISPQRVLDLLLHDLDRPERVLEVCASQSAPTPLMLRSWALALLRLGRIDEAATKLGPIIERQVAATCKLTPKTDVAAETARRKALLAKAIEEYASVHAIDARALLAHLA